MVIIINGQKYVLKIHIKTDMRTSTGLLESFVISEGRKKLESLIFCLLLEFFATMVHHDIIMLVHFPYLNILW